MALDQQDKDGLGNSLPAAEQSKEAVSAEESGLPREVYALLAQANLLRMRGCWEDAVQNCMAALRLAPDSSSAQSLLGDIYENQGRHEDAIQWYRMALDIHPDSPADQMKLGRLLDLQSRHLPRSPQLRSAKDSSLATAADPPQNTDLALRWAATTAALLVLLVVAVAYVSIHRHAALSSLGLASDQEVKTPMVVLPPAGKSIGADASAEGAHDASERALFQALRASPELRAQGVTVWDVQTDPRTAAIILTFGLLPPAGGSLSRDMVLRAALLTAHAAMQASFGQTAAIFTVRCLLTSGGTSEAGSLIFVGDLSRNSLTSGLPADASPTAAQLQVKFSSPWWSSLLPG